MRAAVATASLLALAAPARADVVTTIGAVLDARASGPSFDAAGNSQDLSFLGGARATMSFEARPLALPPPGGIAYDTRIAGELIGGVLGIIIGLAIPFSVRYFTAYRIPISGLSAIIAIVVSSLVGILFGTVPAIRASQLDPVESLRYE